MDYVRLGNTGLKVSRLCLGCMTYGSSKWRPWVLDEEAAMPVDEALETAAFGHEAKVGLQRRSLNTCSALDAGNRGFYAPKAHLGSKVGVEQRGADDQKRPRSAQVARAPQLSAFAMLARRLGS